MNTVAAVYGSCGKIALLAVGAVCDRPYFVDSKKSGRSQSAPTAAFPQFFHSIDRRYSTVPRFPPHGNGLPIMPRRTRYSDPESTTIKFSC